MNENNLQTISFHVHGLHCASCTVIIKDELEAQPEVEAVKVSLADGTAAVTANFGSMTPEEVAVQLSNFIEPHGYRFSVEPVERVVRWAEFKLALPFALALAFLFIILQKSGLINIVPGGSVSYSTAMVIGVVASLSTCMAVVGGLLLSMSASYARGRDALRPQLLFHIGRIVAFFVFGGLIGALGSAFQLNTTMTFILGMLIGLVMFALGLNLLDVFPWTKRLQLSLPKTLTSKTGGWAKGGHLLAPFAVGVATFFLPCGFTQAMQLYTLSTGSFLAGAGTMLSYTLGTLPVLALLSFGSLGLARHRYAGVFFKTAGLVVIMFALFNLINSLVVIGIISPVFNF